ncbi:MAG TPA: hypothetical protein VNZ03_27865 [Terriglobales bacterium]|nr:hypothetical protein [Terriglobales bacterium]
MASPTRYIALLGAISLLPVPQLAIEAAGHTVVLSPQSVSTQSDAYDVLLHSRSLADQRAAINIVLRDSRQYVPRIQESLRNYPRLLRTDPIAARRAVYISALVRDPSFAPILAKDLNLPIVLDDCVYACPVVFALTIQACFAGWDPPQNLDPQLSTVHDLRAEIQMVSRIHLKKGSITDVAQGPGIEEHRKEFDGKSEEEIIQIAGQKTSSEETRMYAAFWLETLVTGSKNRIDLYLLALNDFEDGSGEYKGAVYQSIYRAELAKTKGQ